MKGAAQHDGHAIECISGHLQASTSQPAHLITLQGFARKWHKRMLMDELVADAEMLCERFTGLQLRLPS